jgi:hypothetical protein
MAGRKKVNIEWKTVENLLMSYCSGVEIAAHLGIHENTLYNRCKIDKKMDFVAFSQEKKAKGDSLLKAKQFESAVTDKSIPMQIWLGKQRLGQKDKSETDIKINDLRKTTSELFPSDL